MLTNNDFFSDVGNFQKMYRIYTTILSVTKFSNLLFEIYIDIYLNTK